MVRRCASFWTAPVLWRSQIAQFKFIRHMPRLTGARSLPMNGFVKLRNSNDLQFFPRNQRSWVAEGVHWPHAALFWGLESANERVSEHGAKAPGDRRSPRRFANRGWFGGAPAFGLRLSSGAFRLR